MEPPEARREMPPPLCNDQVTGIVGGTSRNPVDSVARRSWSNEEPIHSWDQYPFAPDTVEQKRRKSRNAQNESQRVGHVIVQSGTLEKKLATSTWYMRVQAAYIVEYKSTYSITLCSAEHASIQARQTRYPQIMQWGSGGGCNANCKKLWPPLVHHQCSTQRRTSPHGMHWRN